MPEKCLWCDQYITDDRKVSGANKADWSINGDFGCDDSPETTSEGVGSHYPISQAREVVKATVFQL
jgi:hypothetical protein